MLRKKIADSLSESLTLEEKQRLASLYRLLQFMAGTAFVMSFLIGVSLLTPASRQQICQSLQAITPTDQLGFTILVTVSLLLPGFVAFWMICQGNFVETLSDTALVDRATAKWMSVTAVLLFLSVLVGFWADLGFAN
ncbi:hypothetical protein IQ266_12310 [filamentous cyanobacterium LEGE 11480]|uniref:Uncharacterized protein n=1 Tax=Romeriopsis navalis LEGE 11480 TaxID=2777977 RepID=A0A928Z3C2_9CYAN|nr:hypothetical protein [Romeriopsis navalis]MBE9030514.1 hypothetical protein [Romeriopsis navalis LEGE 11480]